MTPSELAAASVARGRACAAKNATSEEFADSYLVGWLQEELTNALTVITAADTPGTRRYLETFRTRLSTPSIS